MDKKNPSILIVHHGDSDGLVSALVCKSQLSKSLDNPVFSFLPFSCGMKEELDSLKAFDQLYLLDVSFTKETMDELYNYYKDNFIWIDHHISSINKLAEENSYIEGIRSINDSACKLCFRYFFGKNEPLPVIVDLIDKWDMHKTDSPDFEELVIPANLIFMNFCDDIQTLESLDLLSSEGAKQTITSLGSILKTANDRRIARELRKVFESKTKHNLSAVLLNSTVFSSETIEKYLSSLDKEDRDKKELGCVFSIFKHDNLYKVKASIYKLPGAGPEINCAKLAEEYGGGGHKNAAGFITTMPAFTKDFL